MQYEPPLLMRLLLSVALGATSLLAAASTWAEPVADNGALSVFSTPFIRHPFSFTTDGVSDFSGGSDSASSNLEYDRVNQARWGEFANGHL